jgi:hypothetical protein
MAKGNLPFESLTAATAAGPGAVNDLQDTLALHSLTAQITDFAGTGNWTIRLEASLDNVNFVALQSQTLNEDVNIHFVGVVTFPARYVRANLLLDSGVTSITVTAWVASA